MAQGREAEQGGDEFEAQAVSAFGEAFNNVAIHGFRDLPPGNVDIEISWTKEQIIIQMTDSGRIFDPDATPLPALDELPEGGMGIFIMRSFMDEVEYKAGPPNVLRLIKRRGSEDERVPDDVPISDDRASAKWVNDGTAGARGGRSTGRRRLEENMKYTRRTTAVIRCSRSRAP
jgi:serine/threonine-protein kinase RsbW